MDFLALLDMAQIQAVLSRGILRPMRWSPEARRGLAFLSLFSLLFMQLSVAAYACAKGALQDVVAVVSTDDGETSAMIDCVDMDPEQMLLCHTHCHGQTLSADLSLPPPLALPVIDLVGSIAIEQSRHALRPLHESGFFPPALLAHALAPPARVVNCCFLN